MLSLPTFKTITTRMGLDPSHNQPQILYPKSSLQIATTLYGINSKKKGDNKRYNTLHLIKWFGANFLNTLYIPNLLWFRGRHSS